MCHYRVELNTFSAEHKSIFSGENKFSVRPREVFNYELTFLPDSEDTFEVSASHDINVKNKYIFSIDLIC